MKKIKVNKKGSTLFILFAFLVLGITILGYTYDLCRIMYYKVYLKNAASSIALSITNRCHYIYSNAITGTQDDEAIGVMIMDSPIGNLTGGNSSDEKVMISKHLDYIKQLESDNTPYYQYVGAPLPFGTFSNITSNADPSTPIVNRNFATVYADKLYLQKLIKAQKLNGFNARLSLADTKGVNNVNSLDWQNNDFIISLDESDINRKLSTSNEGITTAMVNAYITAYTSQEITEVYGSIDNLNRYMHGKDGKNGEAEIYLVAYVKHFFISSGLFSGQGYSRIYSIVMAQPQVYVENLALVGENNGNTIYK